MRVIARRPLKECWGRCPDTKLELKAWFAEAEHAQWRTPAEVKANYGSASILKDGRAVVGIRGNKCRLVVRINYALGVVYIRFVGTHKEYDAIDAQTI